MEYKVMNNSTYPSDCDGNPETTGTHRSPDPENNVMMVMGWWVWQHHGEGDKNKRRLWWENNEVRCQGNTRGQAWCGMTAVKYDTVMASCIDGPSHKWAIQSVTSHDLEITWFSAYCGVMWLCCNMGVEQDFKAKLDHPCQDPNHPRMHSWVA